MAKPAWQSLTIQGSVVGLTAGAVVTYMIVFVPPDTKFKIGNLNFKPADVVSFLSTLGAVPASLLALIGRLKATGVVFTPHNVIGFDQDVALKIEAEKAISAATAIELPPQVTPQAVQAALSSAPTVTAPVPVVEPKLANTQTTYSPIVVAGKPTILLVEDTIAKQSTADSSTLDETNKARLKAGAWSIDSIAPAKDNHYTVNFPDKLNGKKAWFIWGGHIADKDKPKTPVKIAPQSASGDVDLPIPYLTQLNNGVFRGRDIELSSCNVTCAAMAARYYGIVGNGNGQLEVQMWQWLLDNGLDYGNADHIDRLIESYGLVDDFNPTATLADIDAALRAGYPVILQGWFTPSGHFVVGKGIQGDHYRIHDPAGLWDRRVRGGYNHDASGEDVLYSRNDIYAACNDNGIYLHVISRPKK